MTRYVAVLLAVWLLHASSGRAEAPISGAALLPAYLTSTACASCHTNETTAWRPSHHAWAWRLPTDQTVLADFNDTAFANDDADMRFERRGESFHITSTAKDGTVTEYEVVGTAGVAPLQQYLVETELGRVQALDVAWDAVKKRWYDIYPYQNLSPGDGLHWTGPYKNWNARCAECHATGYDKNYDPLSHRYASAQAEIGVGCEACHGPGEAHVEWADDPAAFDATRWSGVDARGFTIDFADGNPQTEVQQCAACHSRRETFTGQSPLPGTPFHDAYRLALLRPGLYHPDGSILDEVYVYGSFLQSKMSTAGVRCTNCHEPHSGTLRAPGNAVCTQCHSLAGNPDFPTLTVADYESTKHHFHEPGSEGAQCKSCHMIERVYMGNDWRRDHSFRIPRPNLSATLGTPNACNDCHEEQTAEWAAAEIAKRFPTSAHQSAHFASAFATASQDSAPPRTADSLVEAALDESLPGIVRASALHFLLRHPGPDIAERTHPLLESDDPLIRAAAIPLQRAAVAEVRLRRIAPLLGDARKAVRVEAARSILDLPAQLFTAEIAEAARAAVAEHRQVLVTNADFPEAQMAIAGTALVFRRFAVAEAAFSEAARMDPQMIDAWVMIARLRTAQGDTAGAKAAARKGLAANPNAPALSRVLKAIDDTEKTR